jgi:S-adenosylmethionine/arginine decarboxylase-like enzyme
MSTIFTENIETVRHKGRSLPDTDEMLAEIERITPAVHAAVDKINAAIRKVEQKLEKAGAGVHVVMSMDGLWVSVGDIHDYPFEPHKIVDEFHDGAKGEDKDRLDSFYKSAYLSYERHNGTYRIMVTEVATFEDPDDEDNLDGSTERIFHKPLAESPRDKKMYMVAFLPDLVYMIGFELAGLASAAESLADLKD